MSYLEYYKNHNQKLKPPLGKPKGTEFIKGTCMSMCPQEEIAMRTKEKLVHVLEVIGTIRKFVKCYSRSAADSLMAVPRLLRPYSVLNATVHYLLLEVTKRTDVPVTVVYDFINDRLRSVRQDITIQRLHADECMTLLEPMIRFYVYFGYKLCELSEFDPVLNKKCLLECIKWFLSCCDTKDMSFQNVDDLSGLLWNLEVINEQYGLTCDRVLVESLYILSNLDDMHPLCRYLSLEKNIKHQPSTQLAYQIALANLKGNFVAVSRMFERLCPLTYCALCINLPVLQRRGLLILTHAYNSKQLTVPLRIVKEWLLFNSDSEVTVVCKHYGLKVEHDAVRFNKADFCNDAVIHTPKKILLLDGKLDLTTENIFTYSTK